MTPGMHSSHLGAYESRPGVWVWGPRPSAEGERTMDARRGPLTGLLSDLGVPTMTGTWPGDAAAAAEAAAESEAVSGGHGTGALGEFG